MVETIPLPPRSKVGYLDASIANEGAKVVEYATGEPLTFTPPPPNPIVPDWSEIKSLRRYFNRTGYEPWPAWFYNPQGESILLKDQAEAEKLGIWYRMPSKDEIARYGNIRGVWDWAEGCAWRPTPYLSPKFDPKNPGHGKEFIDPMRDPGAANRHLVQYLTEAITRSLQANGAQAPATVDPKQWAQFQQFVAWQKASETVGAAMQEDASAPASAPQASFGGALDSAMNTLKDAANGTETKNGAHKKR